MSTAVTLEVASRAAVGSAPMRRLRAEGRIPGIIYGTGATPESVEVDRRIFLQLIHKHGRHALVNLNYAGGEKRLALIQEVQVDPVRMACLHIDFKLVDANATVENQVTLEVIGEPKEGTVVIKTMTLLVEALPSNLPTSIPLDVSQMQVGGFIRASEVPLPEGVTLKSDPDLLVAAIGVPSGASADDEAAAAASAAAGAASGSTADGAAAPAPAAEPEA